MSGERGTDGALVVRRPRPALPRDPGRRRLLITVAAGLGLWLFAFSVFSTAPLPERNILIYRTDANQIVAQPRSDAAMDYLNGMAILSGDGWVNWRNTNRWSVYRPGWGALLGGLALLTGGEPRAMQAILTFLLAGTAPAFMLLLLYLYAGAGDLLLAVVVTVLWILNPFFGWSLHRTMMSEGPTMLLSIVFCVVAIRVAGRLGGWTWRQGLLLGLVAGTLSLVREQSRFGVLAVVVLLAIASAGRLRRRLPFFVAVVCGMLVLVGPLYLKTSIHLRMPYAGTSFTALYNMLQYSRVGREVGGTSLPGGAALSEREATKELQRRVRRGLEVGLGRPWEMSRQGFVEVSRYIHGAVGMVARRPLPALASGQPVLVKLLVYHALTALGLFCAWRGAGPVALAPLVFAAGYISPTVPFAFYSNRFGVPISWVGLVYVAGALLLFRPTRVHANGAAETRPHPGAVWPSRRLFLLVGAWLALATSVLLWVDHRPLSKVDVESLFADSRSRQALARAGVDGGPRMIEEADRLLNQDGESEGLLAGVAVFPMTIDPGDEPVIQPFSKEWLPAGEESYGLFYLVSPWKRGGTLRVSRVRLEGDGAKSIRPGDQVLVVRAADSAETVGKNQVVRLHAAAALPTRWGE